MSVSELLCAQKQPLPKGSLLRYSAARTCWVY